MATPITRALALDLKKDAAPSVSEANGVRTFTFIASDGEFDRYNDRLDPSGWDLEAFSKNAVILFGHDDSSKDPKALPIGKGRAYVSGGKLLVDVTFDQSDDFAKAVESKVANGFLNCVSVRYLMQAYTTNERGGFDCSKQELLEISVVTVPGNSRAVRVKEAPGEMDELKARIAALEAKLAPPEPKPEEKPAEPSPEVSKDKFEQPAPDAEPAPAPEGEKTLDLFSNPAVVDGIVAAVLKSLEKK